MFPFLKRKPLTQEQQEAILTKDFFDCISPATISFLPEWYRIGDSCRCVWAVREYPHSTEEQAIFAQLADHSGVTMRIYLRPVEPAEQRQTIQNALRRNKLQSSDSNITTAITGEVENISLEELIPQVVSKKEVLPDLEKAFSLMQTEAETGNGFAMHDLGKMLLTGLGCDKDEEAAQRWFEKALESFIQEEADTKNPAYLQYRIGKMYSFGYGVEQNHLQAAQWYEKAVAGKNIFAAYSLGSLYHRGQGVAQDEDRAYALFLMAANDSKKPNAYAAYTLGRMCREGVGTPASKEQSDSWYRRAYHGFLSMEETMADDKLYYRLGQMNLSGTGTETDLEKAEFYFRKAAELNNIDALYGLGKLYLNKSYDGCITYFQWRTAVPN